MPRSIAALLVLVNCTALNPTPPTRPALYFPGGGLYYWWQAGAVARLQRSDHAGPVCGASAGALAATLYKCGVDMDAARDLALELSTPLLDRGALGLIGRWGPVVRTWLEELLPADASERCSDLKLLYLRRNRVYYRRKAADSFTSRADVIDACLASCHVPFVLDGRPETRYRGRGAIDGSLFLPRRERRAVVKALGSDYVRVDWKADLGRRGPAPDGFVLPSKAELRPWIERVGRRGYAWAEAALGPGGVLDSCV